MVPQTIVFHSVFAVKMALAVLGGVLLVLVLVTAVLVVMKENNVQRLIRESALSN